MTTLDFLDPSCLTSRNGWANEAQGYAYTTSIPLLSKWLQKSLLSGRVGVVTVVVAVITTGLVCVRKCTDFNRELELSQAEATLATDVANQLSVSLIEEGDTVLTSAEQEPGTIGSDGSMGNNMHSIVAQFGPLEYGASQQDMLQMPVVETKRQGHITRRVLAVLRARYGVIERTEAGRALIRRFIEQNDSLVKGIRHAHLAQWLPRIYFLASQPTRTELVYARMAAPARGWLHWYFRYTRPDTLNRDHDEYRNAMSA